MKAIIWKALFILAVPLVPLAAAHGGVNGAATGRDEGKARAGEVQCLIRSANFASGIQLEGVSISGRQFNGSYRFDVRKRGPAGTSTSAQSGEFEARQGEAVIGQVGLGLERGASYEAELVLRWDGGETSCRVRGPEPETGAKR
jgi:hypothetical protein